jgi:hypothetical protein
MPPRERSPPPTSVMKTPGSGLPRILRLAVEANDMASFVQQQANTQWMWLALNTKTRQVIALHGGDRSRPGA